MGLGGGAELDELIVMKAAVYHGKGLLPIEDIPYPTLEDGEVLLQIEACSVCGTDLRTYRHGDAKIAPPRVLGHEFCGRIVESRAGNDLKIGDRVVMYIVIFHGNDRYIEMGRGNLSSHRTTMGYHHDGGFAPFMKIPAPAVRQGNLFKVRDEIPSAHASVAEPLGCVMNAHSRLGVGLKDTVAVIGAGPIGLMHALLARQQGAQKVILLDNNPRRLEMAGRFDIDATVLVDQKGTHRDEVARLTDGYGPSVVIVAVSAAAAQNEALEIAAKAGRVNFFAGLPKSSPVAALNINHVHYKELEISGSYSEKKSDFQAALALINRGHFPADKIITHTLPLNDVEKAFDLMESGEALKVCIQPND